MLPVRCALLGREAKTDSPPHHWQQIQANLKLTFCETTTDLTGDLPNIQRVVMSPRSKNRIWLQPVAIRSHRNDPRRRYLPQWRDSHSRIISVEGLSR